VERIKTQRKFVSGNTVLAFNPATCIEVPVHDKNFISYLFVVSDIAFSGLTLLVGRQEEHLACKN